MDTTINFFWSGDNFDYLNYITILSHLKVGHICNIWLHGNFPKSQYWHFLNFLDDSLNIYNADNIFNISEFLLDPETNIKTASDLWRFNFLYKYGGWYSDCDAFAIKSWDAITNDYMVCSGETDNKQLSIGVIKIPRNEDLFLECISNVKKKWGNVTVFDKYFNKYRPEIEHTDYKLFYPFSWDKWDTLLNNVKIPDNCYSVHLYNTMFYRNIDMNDIEEISKHNNLLNKLVKFCFS